MERTFVNRIDERSYLNRALKYDGKDNPVLVFTGIGGMGKTALRLAFEEQVLKPNNIPHAVVDYDGDPNLRSIEATLRTIRRQLGRHGVRTPVFDYLYARYFELSMGVKISSSNCPPELEGVVTILEGIPVVGSVAQILHGLSQLGLSIKERLQHKEWLYRLRDLEPREVLSLLPEVLAEDLEEAMTTQSVAMLKTSGYRLPLFFDAYERLAESQIDDTLHRKLLFGTPHLLRVVLTRDPLPWEQRYPKEWLGKIEHYPSLKVLSQKDSVLFLSKKQIKSLDLHDHLYQLTGGYPFHLELCADICGEIVESGQEPGISDFEGLAQVHDLTEELVARLLRQLKDDERDLMGLACYPRWVTKDILEELSSIPESVRRIFKKFQGLSIFSSHPEIAKAYVIRKEVRDCLFQKQRQRKRIWQKMHNKLAAYHQDSWQETQSYHHLREVIYHSFYGDSEGALELFEKHLWQLLEAFNFSEAEGLLEAVPQETLDEMAKRKVDYARARLLTVQSGSQQSLLAAKHLYEALVASEIDTEFLSQCLFYSGDLLRALGEFSKALEHYQKALAIRLKVYTEEHPDVARSYHKIGIICDEQGEYERALEYFQKSIAIRLKVYGEKHPDVARSYNSLGIAYVHMAEYKEALEYFRKALAIRLKVYGEEHPDIANSYHNIGIVYKEHGEYGKALEYSQKSLNVFQKVYGKEHPYVADSYNNIGCVYYDQGEYGRTLKYYQKSIAIRLKVYGEKHPDIAASYHNIGNVYCKQGKYGKALEYYQKSLAICLKIYKEEHPTIAKIYTHMGLIYCSQGEYERALEYHQKSLAICLKVYGEEHPDVAESYHNIGIVYKEQDEYGKALEYSQKGLNVFQKVYGEEHPFVADVYDNIGSVYKKQREEYEKALEYYQKALAIRLKVYGEEHPDVADSYNGIAYTLYALNKVEEAFERIRQSIEIYCKFRLWKDAVEALDTLVQWLEEKGKNNEAQEVRAEAHKIRKDHALDD